MQCVREDSVPLRSCYYLHPLASAETLVVPRSLTYISVWLLVCQYNSNLESRIPSVFSFRSQGLVCAVEVVSLFREVSIYPS